MQQATSEGRGEVGCAVVAAVASASAVAVAVGVVVVGAWRGGPVGRGEGGAAGAGPRGGDEAAAAAGGSCGGGGSGARHADGGARVSEGLRLRLERDVGGGRGVEVGHFEVCLFFVDAV